MQDRLHITCMYRKTNAIILHMDDSPGIKKGVAVHDEACGVFFFLSGCCVYNDLTRVVTDAGGSLIEGGKLWVKKQKRER